MSRNKENLGPRPELDEAVAATFKAWKDMERVEICQDVSGDSKINSRTYGSENPNDQRYREPSPISMRTRRSLHLREIADAVDAAVKIAKPNRFKA